MYIEIENNIINSQWIKKQTCLKNITNKQLESIGIYNIEIPINNNPHITPIFKVEVI